MADNQPVPIAWRPDWTSGSVREGIGCCMLVVCPCAALLASTKACNKHAATCPSLMSALKKMQEVAGLSGAWQHFGRNGQKPQRAGCILALIDLVSKGATELSSHAVCLTWGCQAPVASFTRRPCSDHLSVVGCICNWRCSLAFCGVRSLAFCGVRSLAFCAVCNLALCTCAKAKPHLKIQD